MCFMVGKHEKEETETKTQQQNENPATEHKYKKVTDIIGERKLSKVGNEMSVT